MALAENQMDVVLVAAFGKGNWLAAELAASGLKVALVETSEHFKRWTPEDWEGPFGYFQTDKLSASQKIRLIEEDYIEDLPEGMTIWLPDGPLDFKSSLSPHLLSQRGMSPHVLKYLSEYDSLSPEQIRLMQEKFKKSSFAETWVIHLAYQLASHVFKPNAEGINYGRPLPFFAPWVLRRVSRKGSGNSLDWVVSQGVKLHMGAEVVDLSADRGKVSSIEIRSAWSGVLSAHQFVWMLSGEETEKLSPRVASLLYPHGIVKASWNWTRFRIRVTPGIYLENLPIKFIMIEDLYAPWTHTNFLIVQRTVQSQDLDIWLRIPNQHRFQRAYLEERGKEIVQLLRQRIPECGAIVADHPQDYLYEYQELGPSRFPLYEENDLSKLRRAKFSNLYYSSVEDWVLLEWGSVLRDQVGIDEKIQKWKKGWDQLMLRDNRPSP